MGKVLDDFDALDAAYDEAMQLISARDPELFERLSAKPAATAVAEEKVRRQLTLGKVGYKRNYMRRLRARGGEVQVTAVRDLTPEEEASILRELDTVPPS
jgi:hypothetical protein